MHDSTPGRSKIRHLRWYIVILLCFASELNYMDRATLSVVKNRMQSELNFDDQAYAMVATVFLWVYAFSYLVVGWVVDRLGSRRSMMLFVSGWSLANMMHAFSTGVGSLAVFRGLLATMEPGSFPAGMKGVAEWFPMRERALATGIFIAGTSLGSTLAIPVAEVLADRYGWQSAFIVTGLIGFAWVAIWYALYQTPDRHPNITEEERTLIMEGRRDDDSGSSSKAAQPLNQFFALLKMKETWGCVFARVCTDPISYFLLFWAPSFLRAKGGYVAEHFASLAWIPFAAMMVGYMSSGVVPRLLIAAGWSLDAARKSTILTISLLALVLCLQLMRTDSSVLGLIIFAGVCYCHGAWGMMTFPAEVFPKSAVGTVTGLGGFLGAIVGGVFQLWIGRLAAGKNELSEQNYATIFTVCAFAYIVGLIGVQLLIGRLGVIREIKANR